MSTSFLCYIYPIEEHLDQALDWHVALRPRGEQGGLMPVWWYRPDLVVSKVIFTISGVGINWHKIQEWTCIYTVYYTCPNAWLLG